MDLIGRAAETEALESAVADSKSHLWPVYGRRRVGKTHLLRALSARHPGFHFTGNEGPPALQQRQLLAKAASVFGSPLLAAVAPTGWKQTLELAVTAGLSSTGRKLVLVLDEFQWTVAASPELPSIIQQLWDHQWADTGRVMLVLCGSYIGFMEREVLGSKSPLFGRRTGSILLEPLPYHEARQFHPEQSRTDAARTWFLCGGIPHYLKAFRIGASVEENLRDVVLDPFGALHGEPDFLLREQLRDLPTYHATLMAIATGHTRVKDIATASTVPRERLAWYLNQLVSLRYIRKRYPLTGSPPANRSVRYAIADPLLQLWFRFVYPNLGALEAEGAARFFDNRVRPGLSTWFGARFEALCREALARVYRAQGISGGFQVGEYWAKDAQIDVVGLREDGRTDLGECKWSALDSWVGPSRQLEARAGSFPNPRGATLGRLLFARSGPPDPPPATRCLDIDALYADELER